MKSHGIIDILVSVANNGIRVNKGTIISSFLIEQYNHEDIVSMNKDYNWIDAIDVYAIAWRNHKGNVRHGIMVTIYYETDIGYEWTSGIVSI